MKSSTDNYDSEDMFADTRMSFGDHLEDLRTHLWRAVIGFAIAMCLSFFIGKPFLDWFIIHPVEVQLQEYYDRLDAKQKAKALDQIAKNGDLDANKPRVVELEFDVGHLQALAKGEKPKPLAHSDNANWVRLPVRIPDPVILGAEMMDAQRLLGRRPTVKSFGIAETFMVYFKVCMVCGLVVGSPWIFYQIWAFVAAGLYPHEKKYVHIYLPFSLGLFLLGALACQFVVLPKAIQALLWFNEWLDVEPDLRLNEWLGFAIMLPLVFGLSFQTPLVMLFMERIGLFTVETYRKKRRIAFFILAVIACFGPSLDAFSMIFQWIALCLLYQLGIWLCIWSPSRPESDIETPASDELVEV
jgi:sec-independent protein translocase protein TatC